MEDITIKTKLVKEAKSIAESVENANRLIQNISAWLNSKEHECALITTKSLIKELERMVGMDATG